MVDDCNEGDCNCRLESIDSIWFDEEKANEQAKKRYHGTVTEEEVRE